MTEQVKKRLPDKPISGSDLAATQTLLDREALPVLRDLRQRFNELVEEVASIGEDVAASQLSSYVVIAADATLANERVLTGSGNVTVTDGGPGEPVTIGSIGGAVGEIALHDTTHAPVGLWQFQGSLADASGNGFTLSVDAGSAEYSAFAQRILGVRLNGLRLKRAHEALLTIPGDMTIGMFCLFEEQPEPSVVGQATALVTYTGGTSDASADYNYQYQLDITVTPGRLMRWFSEHGVGVNDSYTLASHLPAPGVPFHLMATRTANVVQFYLNGTTFGAASAALTTPDGGTLTELYVGGTGGVGTLSTISSTLMASLIIIPSALTAAQVKTEYNRTMGPFLGGAP